MLEKNKLREILLDQLEERDLLLKRCRVERDIEPVMREGLNDNLIKVIMGVRRCGKSVLAHRLLQGKTYGAVNFDDERLFRVTSDDLNLILETLLELRPGIEFILLDEIQNVEGWELFVNRLQRQGYKTVITGSNAHLLSRELATHLTGRHRIYEVFPYSFCEFLRAAQYRIPAGPGFSTRQRAEISALFTAYIEEGGFPEIRNVVNPRVYLQDLYDRAITRDIAMRHGVRHIRTLKEVATQVAANCSCKLTYKNVAQAYGLGSVHTAKNYISYLQEAYLFFAVESFSFKVREKVRRPRKMYCIDTGLLRAVNSASENRGLILENLVFLDLMRQGRQVHYYADAQGKYEVDFVVGNGKSPDDIQLVQVCSDMSRPQTRERELRGLVQAAAAFGNLPDKQLLVLTADDNRIEPYAGHHIRCLPVWEWLLSRPSSNDTQ